MKARTTMAAALLGLALAAPLLCGCDRGGDGGGDGDAQVIAECEQYFRRAQACFAKNPVAKATLGQSVDQVRDMLRPRSGQPLERARMADVCRERTATLAQSCN